MVSEILYCCEERGEAPPFTYTDDGSRVTVPIDVPGDVVIVSDMHIAAGRLRDGRYTGTENFFDDDSFLRFVRTTLESTPPNSLLLINGDFIDFLRIVEVPRLDEEFEEWSQDLAEIGDGRSATSLKSAITDRERDLGLKTHDYRSFWRIKRAVEGHPNLFVALGEWMSVRGNRLAIVKGNHDLEWFWLAVRNGLRLEVGKEVANSTGVVLTTALTEYVVPNLWFFDDAVLINRELFVEHGHRYDKFTEVRGPSAKIYSKGSGEKELNIPFGSFFNRYLLNRLEGAYPFIDNVRPRANILPILVRERFPLAISIMFKHVGFLLRVLQKEKKYTLYVLGRLFTFLIALGLPILLVVLAIADDVGLFASQSATQVSDDGFWGSASVVFLDGVKYVGGLVLSYVLARLVAWLQLTEPESLEEFGLERFRDDVSRKIRFVVMGHTHNPDQRLFNVDDREGWFFNTGTWIPIVETSSAELRRDQTFSFLRFKRLNGDGEFARPDLERWNDDAGRAEPFPIVGRA